MAGWTSRTEAGLYGLYGWGRSRASLGRDVPQPSNPAVEQPSNPAVEQPAVEQPAVEQPAVEPPSSRAVEPLTDLTGPHLAALDAQVGRVGEILEATPTLTIGKVTVGPHA
ncbi:hypothetical protein [Embleya sp. NBC_00896]|uniref:hypothetical protein n=1 Tax=Embleya sp. NBC_00896 TaxID=2975961 RepID=UPI003866E011|nr:hypothetical protein OG928_02365 [Embleya sp. NBC_00896]